MTRRVGSAVLGTLPRDAFVSSISVAELLYGAEETDRNAVRDRQLGFVNAVIATLTVEPFDLPQAREYARLWVPLRKSGRMIGERDLMIAATAIAGGHALMTYNVNEFRRVPGLELVAAPVSFMR